MEACLAQEKELLHHNKIQVTLTCERRQWSVLSGVLLVQSSPGHAGSSTPCDQCIILDFSEACNDSEVQRVSEIDGCLFHL